MSDRPTVIILAGGENSRFFPLNTGTHKGGRIIAGKLLINRCIEDIRAHGFNSIKVVVSEKDFGGKGLSNQLDPSLEFVLQREPKGQADAIIAGAQGTNTDCIVASPYYFNAGSVAQQLVERKEQTQADCVVLVSVTDQPALYGMVELEDDNLKSITEKSKQCVNSTIKINSFYLFSRSFLQKLAATKISQYSLESTLNDYAQTNTVKVIKTDQPLPSLKFSWQLLDVMNQILSQQTGSIDSTVQVANTAIIDQTKGPVVIAAGANIRHFAVINGPAYIGENVLVGEYSFVRGSSIEANCKIGANSEIVRSLLSPEVTIHAGYCADSILGEKTTVGAGLITANVRLDGAMIQTIVAEQKRPTNKQKMGLITGDHVHIGVRVTTMPGTLIASASTIYPNVTLFSNVSARSVVKAT